MAATVSAHTAGSDFNVLSETVTLAVNEGELVVVAVFVPDSQTATLTDSQGNDWEPQEASPTFYPNATITWWTTTAAEDDDELVIDMGVSGSFIIWAAAAWSVANGAWIGGGGDGAISGSPGLPPSDGMDGDGGLGLGFLLACIDDDVHLTTPTEAGQSDFDHPHKSWAYGHVALDDTDTLTIAGTISSSDAWGAAWGLIAATAEPVSLDLGQPTETDSTFALTRAKTFTLGLPVENDSVPGALSFSSATLITLGLPVETDSTFAITSTRLRTLGLPVETDTAFALNLGGWAFEDPMDSLDNWTMARWRSVAFTANAGAVGVVDDDYLGRDGQIPPDDVFIADGAMQMSTGSQNYGDTYARCAQPFDFPDQEGVIECDVYLPTHDALAGWPQIVVTSEPYTAPSSQSDNSDGPTPLYGFSIRLNDHLQSVPPVNEEHPLVLVWDNHEETILSGGETGGPAIDNTVNHLTHVRVEFTATHLSIYADGELWYDNDWELPEELVRGWLYLGNHNHASMKYRSYMSTRTIWDNVRFSGRVLQASTTAVIPDNIQPMIADEDSIFQNGVNIGWHLPSGTLTIPDVPGAVKSAKLLASMTVDGPQVESATRMVWSLNGHTAHSEVFPQWDGTELIPVGATIWSLDVPLGELVEGDNDVTFAVTNLPGGYTPFVGNIGLLTFAADIITNLPVETDTAFPLTRTKVLTLGLPVETDSTFPVTSVQGVTVGMPVETDSSFAITRTKTKTLGLPVETDSVPGPLTTGATTTLELGLPPETDSAPTLTLTKSYTLGVAVELDSTFALVVPNLFRLGLPVETDRTFALVLPAVVVPMPDRARMVTVPAEQRMLIVDPEVSPVTLHPNTPILKDPDAELQYDMDWLKWLRSKGDGTDELASVDVAVFLADGVTEPPTGDDETPLEVVGTPTVEPGDGDVVCYVLCRLTGGMRGVTYAVRYRVTTVAGDIEDRTRYVKVRDR